MNLEQIKNFIIDWLPTITAVGGVGGVLVKISSIFKNNSTDLYETLKTFNQSINKDAIASEESVRTVKDCIENINELKDQNNLIENELKNIKDLYINTLNTIKEAIEEQKKKDKNEVE